MRTCTPARTTMARLKKNFNPSHVHDKINTCIIQCIYITKDFTSNYFRKICGEIFDP